MRTSRLLTFLVATAALGLPSAAPACFVRSPQPVQVWLDHIDVEITDQAATKTYNCTFRNPNPRAVVGGTCYMEVEAGARVHNLTTLVNGVAAKAELLDVKRANRVFREMVQSGGSASLLEYYGNQLIQTKVPHIPPRGTVTVKLRYTTVLEAKGGLVRLQMLNTNPKADMQALQSASVRVKIRSGQPLKTVYSPTHPIRIAEDPKWDAVVEWSEKNYLPKHPFVLYYQTSPDRVGATLIAHREPGEAGHFMLLLSPTTGRGRDAVRPVDILPKDVVFCVDRSGSMLALNKIAQAREALAHCLAQLRPGDRFNVVDFGTGVRKFSDRLVDADSKSVAAARRYVERLGAGGGTSIDEALAIALGQLNEPDRVKMIFFATDGLPTVGERSPEAILKKVSQGNANGVRIFTLGEGHDVDSRFLDQLALAHRGRSEYVLPDEEIQTKIAAFFQQIGSPLVTDLDVEFEGGRVADVYPRKLADLFHGEQAILYGRYEGEGPQTVRVRGRVNGRLETFRYKLDFPRESADERNAFVGRLWAGQMVDHLLGEIRLSGREDTELVEEVTRLAKRHGIVTPYTSFLMVADECNRPLAEQVARFRSDLRGRPGALLEQQSGSAAVANASRLARDRRQRVQSGNAAALYSQVADGLRDLGRNEAPLAALRYAGNRTFYNVNNVWYDSRFDRTQESAVRRVRVGSDEYLNLLDENPRLARSMAQGDVVVPVGQRWYRFEQAGRG